MEVQGSEIMPWGPLDAEAWVEFEAGLQLQDPPPIHSGLYLE